MTLSIMNYLLIKSNAHKNMLPQYASLKTHVGGMELILTEQNVESKFLGMILSYNQKIGSPICINSSINKYCLTGTL